jgi:hypothetical protein
MKQGQFGDSSNSATDDTSLGLSGHVSGAGGEDAFVGFGACCGWWWIHHDENDGFV